MGGVSDGRNGAADTAAVSRGRPRGVHRAAADAEVRASLHLPDDVGRKRRGRHGEHALSWSYGAPGSGPRSRMLRRVVGRNRLRTGRSARTGRASRSAGLSIPIQWGKGYATEGGRATIDYVFAHHDVNEVWSLILEENARSQPWRAASGSSSSTCGSLRTTRARRTGSGASRAATRREIPT